MNYTEYKSWQLKEIAKALEEKNVNKTKIEVPTFQRNLVWSDEQKKMFIDSVKRGFPIGTLLFYKIPGKDTYSLIDGLQRSSTILDYINNPTRYFDASDVENDVVEELFIDLNITNLSKELFSEKIRSDIKSFLGNSNMNDTMLIAKCAKHIREKYVDGDIHEVPMSTMEKIQPCIEKFKKVYDLVAQSQMPVMVFSGDDSDLPTVFERINNQGTQLGKYQIYAASWAVKNYRVHVENESIIDHIIAKYEAFINGGYVLEGYDKDEIKASKELSLFEYVLGLGKYITAKYVNLFPSDKSVQDINQVGFEIINACFGKNNKEIKNLHINLNKIDINLFEQRLLEVIDIVNAILKPYIEFKGNNHGGRTIFHAQNQIVSIIASTFRERYYIEEIDNANNDGIEDKAIIYNFNEPKNDWADKLKKLKTTLPQHYVYDIISHNWAEGAFGKIYAILNDNKYLRPIEKELWDSKLDDWLLNMNERKEKKSIANPKTLEKLFLNCVYLNQFSSFDQLNDSNFDIEHLATKECLKTVIREHSWEGLPISSIGNLCYLPQYDNRSKGAKTIYQDVSYIDKLQAKGLLISDIEEKYTFTCQEDMEWLSKDYSDIEYETFRAEYIQFLNNRFEKMKSKFYATLKIVEEI